MRIKSNRFWVNFKNHGSGCNLLVAQEHKFDILSLNISFWTWYYHQLHQVKVLFILRIRKSKQLFQSTFGSFFFPFFFKTTSTSHHHNRPIWHENKTWIYHGRSIVKKTKFDLIHKSDDIGTNRIFLVTIAEWLRQISNHKIKNCKITQTHTCNLHIYIRNPITLENQERPNKKSKH